MGRSSKEINYKKFIYKRDLKQVLGERKEIEGRKMEEIDGEDMKEKNEGRRNEVSS